MKMFLVYAMLATAILTGPLAAAQFRAGDVQITKAWARATPGASKSAAAYLTLRNTGRRIDRLVGLTTPVARRVAVHGTRMQGNVMQMYSIASVELRPGKSVVLRPGGMHVMLTGLKQILRKGATFPLTLRFAKAGAVEIRVSVSGIGAMGPASLHGGNHGKKRY